MLTDTSDSAPQSWRRSFAVRVNDELAPVLAPRLISQIVTQATGITLRFIADDTDNSDALRNGSLDLDMGLVETPAPDVHVQQLYTHVSVSSSPRIRHWDRLTTFTIDQLCGYPHISAARGALTDRVTTPCRKSAAHVGSSQWYPRTPSRPCWLLRKTSSRWCQVSWADT